MMLHPKQHIPDLARLCQLKGISRVVISPGSRSAPMIRAFYDVFGDRCISIVDERSAAYYALGLALELNAPVALVCTSGTAVLNYAPALAEAYYQHVPLVAITADRPREWIDQQDNQTLHQAGVYANYIKAGFELPQVIGTSDDLWFAHRIINEAIDTAVSHAAGPVHLNVPLSEPLYEPLPDQSEKVTVISREQPEADLRLSTAMLDEWENANRILIIHGQDIPGSAVSATLPALLADARVALIAENISNLPADSIISTSNLVLSTSRTNSPPYPDLIIHCGGQVVSKALAGYLRRAPSVPCWRLGKDHRLVDTFRLVTRQVNENPESVFRALPLQREIKETPYRQQWLAAEENAMQLLSEYSKTAVFCDFSVYSHIWPLIPAGTRLMLGNSSVVRYAQLFKSGFGIQYFANRGVSGIDGTLSTAAGLAMASDGPVLAVIGDLGFLYDSNALWNRDLPANLRILVINNNGGGIFRILKGPTDHPSFTPFVQAHHPADLGKLAEAFGLTYFFADDAGTMRDRWSEFTEPRNRASILEIRTDAATSAEVFRKLMSSP